mmetsp:Transcript_28960/g.54328  ORF Transcript_28960/g.54328 Transcript_28960/m.54328 type:complete len:91 (+) Transcript_28960:2-274(+)
MEALTSLAEDIRSTMLGRPASCAITSTSTTTTTTGGAKLPNAYKNTHPLRIVLIGMLAGLAAASGILLCLQNRRRARENDERTIELPERA